MNDRRAPLYPFVSCPNGFIQPECMRDENCLSGLGSADSHQSTDNLKSGLGGLKTKVCLIGERQVGKSALVQRYVLDQFSDEYFATLGMKVYKKLIYVFPPRSDKAVPVTMVIWDIMGDGKYGEEMKDIYLHGAAGVIAVADITNSETVPPLNKWVNSATELLGDIPMQIVLNKWDAGEDETARHIGLNVAKNHIAPCYLTSAFKGDNVERAFGEIAHRILAQAAKVKPVSEERVMEVLIGSIGQSRTLDELSTEFGVSAPQAEPRVRDLVRNGQLKLENVDVAKDGTPVMTYVATGKLLEK